MKTLLLLLFIASSTLIAGDAPQHVYRGEIAGVVCAACASHVKTALAKLDGVSSVKITLPSGGGVPQLEVVSLSDKLTREQAVKALGDYAKTYEIRSLKMEK